MEPCNGGMKASPIVAWEVVTQTLPENNDHCLTQRTLAVYPNHNRSLCLPYAIRRPDGFFVKPGTEIPFENDVEVLRYFQDDMELLKATPAVDAPPSPRRRARGRDGSDELAH